MLDQYNEDRLVLKKLIGEKTIYFNDIKTIRKANWGLRYSEIHIISTLKLTIYLNNRAYKNLREGID